VSDTTDVLAFLAREELNVTKVTASAAALLLAWSLPVFVSAAPVTELPAAVRSAVDTMHPGAKIDSTSVDEDGLYLVEISDPSGARFHVELTGSGKVVSDDLASSDETKPTISSAKKLDPRLLEAVSRLYPEGRIRSATLDKDGLYEVRVSWRGGEATLELTRSGRVVRHDRDATTPAEDFSYATASTRTTPGYILSARRLPAPVLEAIQRAQPGGVIVHVHEDTYGPRFGRPAWYVKIARDNTIYDMGLTASGSIVQNRVDNRTDRIRSISPAVRDAVRQAYPQGVIYGSSRQRGNTQVDVLQGGVPYRVDVDANGRVVRKGRDQHE